MSFLKFHHVFSGLMLLALLSALVIPQDLNNVARAQVQALFAPVARPVRAIAAAVHRRVVPQDIADRASPSKPRSDAELRRENDQLRQQLAALTVQNERLEQQESQRSAMGDLRRFCTPVAVLGGDSSQGDLLLLQASSLQNLRADMAVLCPEGVVGKLGKVGVAGASVKPLTARGVRVSVSFGKFTPDGQGVLQYKPLNVGAVLEGRGNGWMIASLLKKVDVAELHPEREEIWAILNDTDWPRELQGQRIGRVASIQERRDAPGFSEARVEPFTNLMQLREVMVFNRQSPMASGR
jgi:cell shape-determining protein MreC